MGDYLLAIDQGTSSSRALIIDCNGRQVAMVQRPLSPTYPEDGWVELDAEAIWQTVLQCARAVIAKAQLQAADILSIGISNQRETTLIWDRATGDVIYPAIVWQDRRTSDLCQRMAADEDARSIIMQKTGLLPDPYFSATKISWILDHVTGARSRALAGQLCFGTVETFLLWRFSNGAAHKTDATNASRTMLYDIHKGVWDEDLLKYFNVPRQILPEVCANVADFACCGREFFGAEIPIKAMIGDQQAAAVGQACFQQGMVKSTYGTGCFMLLNTGEKVITSKHRLLSTIAYQLDHKVTYALEGSIFIAGAAVQWLRDSLQMISHAKDATALAMDVEDTGGVYLVPAFTGLGAPYWDPQARGALIGLKRDSGIKQIVRAALEAVCYQSRDLLQAMLDDGAGPIHSLRVDGGMVVNDWLLQFLSDMLRMVVDRPVLAESSAAGAAYLAGLGAGVYHSLDDIAKLWQRQRSFSPQMDDAATDDLYAGWKHAVGMVLRHQ